MESLATRRPDPLGVSLDLPFNGTYFPLGFRLEIATNSRRRDRGGRGNRGQARTQEFACDPLTHAQSWSQRDGELSAGLHAPQAGAPLFGGVATPYNFAHIDLRSQCRLRPGFTEDGGGALLAALVFRRVLAYVMLAQRQVVMVHAGCVARNGTGVLLCGASESGKSTLSYACARAGMDLDRGRLHVPAARFARADRDRPLAAGALPGGCARAISRNWNSSRRERGRRAKSASRFLSRHLPGIRTSSRAPIGALAFLERGPGTPGVAAHPRERSGRSPAGGHAVVRTRSGRTARSARCGGWPRRRRFACGTSPSKMA